MNFSVCLIQDIILKCLFIALFWYVNKSETSQPSLFLRKLSAVPKFHHILNCVATFVSQSEIILWHPESWWSLCLEMDFKCCICVKKWEWIHFIQNFLIFLPLHPNLGCWYPYVASPSFFFFSKISCSNTLYLLGLVNIYLPEVSKCALWHCVGMSLLLWYGPWDTW